MTQYLARKLFLLIPTAFGVLTIVFIVVRVSGDPARIALGEIAREEQVLQLRELWGLDKPIFTQFVDYVLLLSQGDLGRSLSSNRLVSDEVLRALPATAELAAAGLFLALLVGIPLGLLAATNRGSWLDMVISLVSLFGLSMPIFLLGLLLLYVFGFAIPIFPLGGREGIGSLVLPAVTLAANQLATITRMTRSALLDVLTQDYIRTARGKGVAQRTIHYRHALRNALNPVITAVGLQLGALLGGAVITETVFAWPGIGRLMVDAITSRDAPLAQGAILVTALSFVAVNVLVDVLYVVVDPRVTYE